MSSLGPSLPCLLLGLFFSAVQGGQIDFEFLVFSFELWPRLESLDGASNGV
jgi:hypothetical protein